MAIKSTSGLNPTYNAPSVILILNDFLSSPVATSVTLTTPSHVTLTISVPSGLKEKSLILLGIPVIVSLCSPVIVSQRIMVSLFPLASVFPSKLNFNMLLGNLLMCPNSGAFVPVFISHKKILLSCPVLAKVCPWGLNSMFEIEQLCSVSRVIS